MRRVVRQSDPQTLDATIDNILPEQDTAGERQHFLFYQDDGGMRATDETNENLDVIYYLGIIDILTPYTTLKRMEHVWKGLRADIVRRALFILWGLQKTHICAFFNSIKSARYRLLNMQTASSRS